MFVIVAVIKVRCYDFKATVNAFCFIYNKERAPICAAVTFIREFVQVKYTLFYFVYHAPFNIKKYIYIENKSVFLFF
jgi:hypothetical protein